MPDLPAFLQAKGVTQGALQNHRTGCGGWTCPTVSKHCKWWAGVYVCDFCLHQGSEIDPIVYLNNDYRVSKDGEGKMCKQVCFVCFRDAYLPTQGGVLCRGTACQMWFAEIERIRQEQHTEVSVLDISAAEAPPGLQVHQQEEVKTLQSKNSAGDIQRESSPRCLMMKVEREVLDLKDAMGFMIFEPSTDANRKVLADSF